ncbi:MAG: SH3 domain-containing protein [Pyrinomonadaceae bacterium]
MRPILLCALIIAPCAFAVHAARLQGSNSPQPSNTKSLLTIASNVRVRVEPGVNAGEAGRLPLGTIVRELERTPDRVKIGAAEDYWYRVAAPGGVEGWVFGALMTPFDSARRAEIYARLAGERLKLKGASFSDLTELMEFLDRAVKETAGRDRLAEFELLRLLALQKTLASIPFEKREEAPYAPWIKAQGESIVYSEPAGEWYVRSEQFWNLERKYHALPLAERIAWEASQIPLPGECEGYLPCHLYYEAETAGHYLKLYPRGAHTAQALDSISEMLAGVVEDLKGANHTYEVPKEDRATFHKQVTDLRAVLSRVTNAKAARTVKQLDEIARHFR